jgi:hypothetical protein
MRTKVKTVLPETTLARIVEAFGQELIDTTDEEIMQAAKDLGMNPDMKASAAYLGLTFPARMQAEDFFDGESIRQYIARATTEQIPESTSNGSDAPRSKQPKTSLHRKDSGRK